MNILWDGKRSERRISCREKQNALYFTEMHWHKKM